MINTRGSIWLGVTICHGLVMYLRMWSLLMRGRLNKPVQIINIKKQMPLKAKDIPALFYPWHSLSEVQDELQKDLIWQITKQQDSGAPQVTQTESLRSQFKTDIEQRGYEAWRDNSVLRYAYNGIWFSVLFGLLWRGFEWKDNTMCLCKKSESYFTQGSALINTSKTPYCISIRLKWAWASATLHGPKQMITS